MRINGLIVIFVVLCSLVIVSPLWAYVNPKICGSQVSGPMIMPEIFIEGQSILVYDEASLSWSLFAWNQSPYLRPLVEPNEFNPTEDWAVLTGKAYNFQYGWDSALINEYPPSGNEFWLKVLYQTPELETYYQGGGYAPIFGTLQADGNHSPDIWMWNMGMQHNVYAVPDTFYGRLTATYKVYIGDAVTGEELVDSQGQPVYTPAYVTFRWLRPCRYILDGDINADCVVDFMDYSIIADQWLQTACSAPFWCDEADQNLSNTVNLLDFNRQAQNWLIDCQATPGDPHCSPRPGPW